MMSLPFSMIITSDRKRERERAQEERLIKPTYIEPSLLPPKQLTTLFTRSHAHTFGDPVDFRASNCVSLSVYFTVILDALLT
jgi:hypothetical protein